MVITKPIQNQTVQATRITAIRHGETDWNTQGRIQGHWDIPLNATGLEQARQTANALAASLAFDGGQAGAGALDAIYSSDLQRAWQTAQAIAHACAAPLHRAPALRERSFGSFEGQTFAALERQHPQATERWRKRDPHFTPPGAGGESLLMLQARIAQAVTQAASAHIGGHIVLVAHGGVMDCLYRLATGQDVQAPRTWALPNAAINRLLWTPQGLSLVGWGDVQHLSSSARDESLS